MIFVPVSLKRCLSTIAGYVSVRIRSRSNFNFFVIGKMKDSMSESKSSLFPAMILSLMKSLICLRMVETAGLATRIPVS